MPFNHLILCRPLLFLPSIFPSIRGCFSNASALCIRRPKYWNLSFNISSSNEYSGLISFSFKIDWFDILADQETLKSLLQHHSSNASNDKICIIIYYYFILCIIYYSVGLWNFFFIISKGYYTSQLNLFSFLSFFLFLKKKNSIPFRSLHGQRSYQTLRSNSGIFCCW